MEQSYFLNSKINLCKSSLLSPTIIQQRIHEEIKTKSLKNEEEKKSGKLQKARALRWSPVGVQLSMPPHFSLLFWPEPSWTLTFCHFFCICRLQFVAFFAVGQLPAAKSFFAVLLLFAFSCQCPPVAATDQLANQLVFHLSSNNWVIFSPSLNVNVWELLANVLL